VDSSLPHELMRHLADAEVEVVSWSAASSELVLRVRKEIGPESGLLRFAGVGHVSLPPRFTVAGLSRTAGPDGDTLFMLAEAWGASYTVAAESMAWEPDAEPGAAADGGGMSAFPGP
jgi:hypothetical protein